MKKISYLFQIIYIVILTYACILGGSSFIYIMKLSKEVNEVAKLNSRNEQINNLIESIDSVLIKKNDLNLVKRIIEDAEAKINLYLIEEKEEPQEPLKNQEIILLEKILLKLANAEKYLQEEDKLNIGLKKFEFNLREIDKLLNKLKEIHFMILDKKIILTTKRQRQILLIDILAIIIGINLFFIMKKVVAKNLINPLKDISADIEEINSGKLAKVKREVNIIEIYELIKVLNNFIEGQKSNEEYIQQLNKKLEEEVQEKTQQLLKLIDELKILQTNMSRLERLAVAGELASMVAHELRKPLNSLALNFELLKRKINRGEKENLDEIMNLLVYEINRIDNILLEFTNAAISKPSIKKEVDLIKIISEVKFLLGLEARRKNILIQLPESKGCIVTGDRDKLRQVIMNLMLNAIQASPEGGMINIEVEKDQDHLRINIMDEGNGVPSEVIPHLFKPFVTTKENGTGLGLAISRRIIEEHNGSLMYEKNEEGKTVFSIILPYK